MVELIIYALCGLGLILITVANFMHPPRAKRRYKMDQQRFEAQLPERAVREMKAIRGLINVTARRMEVRLTEIANTKALSDPEWKGWRDIP